jgi:hypothetical protein
MPPCRVGVVLLPTPTLNMSALQYLLLAMNREQDLIQFESYIFRIDAYPLLRLLARARTVERAEAMDLMSEFVTSAQQRLEVKNTRWGASEPPPERFVVVSPCRFDDNFYSVQRDGVAVLAMGNWKRHMAPLSFVEFVQVMVLRELVGMLCPSLHGPVHLATKGCVLDFTEYLGDTRQKALIGHVCHHCRERMRADGHPDLAGTVIRLLEREWLGEATDPRTPAGVLASLRYDLFTTKGRQETWLEALLTLLRAEATKQIVTITGTVVVAVLILVLGLRAA